MNVFGELPALLSYQLRRLGWPGAVGVTLAAFAAVLYGSGILAAQTQLTRLRGEIEQLRARPTATAAATAVSFEQRVKVFRGFFTSQEELPRMIESIHDRAAANGVAIATADYRESTDPASGLLRLQVTMPLKGSYPQIRAWLGEVMNELPAIALDEFTLKRDRIGNSVLEGRVRFSLYLVEH